MAAIPDSFALVLTGGGARAAYQVGVLRCLARHLPKDSFDVITGVSAGAINAAFVASRSAPLADVIEELCEVWRTLELKDVIRIDSRSLARNVFGWGGKLISGGTPVSPRVRGLVDTTPLRAERARGDRRDRREHRPLSPAGGVDDGSRLQHRPDRDLGRRV